MSAPKALVVEHDDKARKTIDEILAVLGHEYDAVTCLLDARKALAATVTPT